MKKFSSTMKESSRRTSQNKKRLISIFLLGTLMVAIILLLPKFTHVVAGIVVAPVNMTKSWLQNSTASFPQYLRDRSELIGEMDDLRQQVADRSGDRFTADMLIKENTQLRSLLSDDGDSRLLAGVIGRPNQLPYDMLMVDQGEKDGVVVGAPVYIGERTVIGYIQSVTAHSALITLITTPGFTSTVYVLGADVYATAKGIGGGQIQVGIPQGIKVKEGDLVILPSITSGVYGSVNHIEASASQPEQFAYVAPKTPIASLRLVSIGTTPIKDIDFSAAAANVAAVTNEHFTLDVPEGVLGNVISTSTATTSIHHD